MSHPTADFKHIQKVVDELNSTNSSTDKKKILEKYKGDRLIKMILFYVYNPYYQFFVTPKTLEKHYGNPIREYNAYTNFFDLLDALRKREITGHLAINSVNNFVEQNKNYKDLIYMIIGKDIEIRMGDSLINKVIPGLIPTFDVALASSFDDVNVDFENEEWYASRKLDGVRCISVIDGNISCWSRQGNEFETLDKVKADLIELGLGNVVFDGEICMVDENGNEDFQSIMKQIRKKDHTIQKPKYLIFDMVSLNDFNNKSGTETFADRYEKLCNSGIIGLPCLEVVSQIRVKNAEHFAELMAEADAKGWEGLILRKNVGYEGKRSKNMLKCKNFKDAEYTVLGLETGPFRMIGDDGLEETVDVMSNVLIEHKGNQVSVGSGFTIEERKHFKAHPKDIVGKVITVKYFQESKNKDGKYSLRFPTVKVIHGNKRMV